MADVMARNDHLELRLIGDPKQSPDPPRTPAWNSGVLNQGEAFGRIFRKAGTFTKYHCGVHPSALRAIITVT
jgi:plastocyanin